MKILITAAAFPLSKILADSLASDGHDVLLTDRDDQQSAHPFVRSTLDHSSATNELVRGVDAIIHSGDVYPGASVSEQLDYQMRCTYNVLWAAAEERVPRFVYLSSLRLMEGYDPGYAVTERWKTTPTLEPAVLCWHLGEIVCREFAREKKVEVTVLRLGELTLKGASEPSTTALYEDDAVQAVSRSLVCGHSGWLDIFHVQSDVPNARFLTGQPYYSADDFPPSDLGFAAANRSGQAGLGGGA